MCTYMNEGAFVASYSLHIQPDQYLYSYFISNAGTEYNILVRKFPAVQFPVTSR